MVRKLEILGVTTAVGREDLTLRTSIPQSVRKLLRLSAGDRIAWILYDFGDRKVITFEKALREVAHGHR